MNFRTSNRRTLQAGIGLVAAGLLSACGAVDGELTADDSGLPVVKFGATQNPSSIGTVAAVIKQEKLDEECGVSIDPIEFSPEAADIALLSGQTNMGYFGYTSWAGSEEKLQKLAMLAPLQAEHGTLFVPEGSAAQSLADLKGEKIALLPPVSGQYQDFKLLVAKMGHSLENDFKPVTGPPPAIEAFLKRGEVAAAILFEPNATNLELAGGYRPLFKLTDQWQEITGDPLYMLGISANKQWISGHEKEAECVVSAVHKATELLATDPAIYEDLQGILGAEDQQHLTELTENLGEIYTYESADEAAPAIQKQLEEAEKLGLIPSVPDPVFTSIGG